MKIFKKASINQKISTDVKILGMYMILFFSLSVRKTRILKCVLQHCVERTYVEIKEPG